MKSNIEAEISDHMRQEAFRMRLCLEPFSPDRKLPALRQLKQGALPEHEPILGRSSYRSHQPQLHQHLQHHQHNRHRHQDRHLNHRRAHHQKAIIAIIPFL